MTTSNYCYLYPFPKNKYYPPIVNQGGQKQVLEKFVDRPTSLTLVDSDKIIEGNLIPKRCFSSTYAENRIFKFKKPIISKDQCGYFKTNTIRVTDECNIRKRLVNINPNYWELNTCIRNKANENRYYQYVREPNSQKPVIKRVMIKDSCHSKILRNSNPRIGQDCCKKRPGKSKFQQYRGKHIQNNTRDNCGNIKKGTLKRIR